MSFLVFDIETVPDIDTGRLLYGLEDIDDEDVVRAMEHTQAQKTGSEFLPLYLQKIVAIAVVHQHQDELVVSSLGDVDAGEKQLLDQFNHGIDKYVPQLVSWNGGGFDLPVIHYRSLLHGSVAQQYWERGAHNREFQYNNYLSRYHLRHLDLMDVLAGYNRYANAPLNAVAQMLGFPGKLGMEGSQVAQAWRDGKVEAIRNYCEVDVLNTYLVFLRFQLIQGHTTQAEYVQRCEQLHDTLKNSTHAHWQRFAELWSPDAHTSAL